MSEPIAEEIRTFVQQAIDQKITSFSNAGILLPFYSKLNGVWRAHQKINLRIKSYDIFRIHMWNLADLIMEKSSKHKSLNSVCSNFITTLNKNIIK